MSEERKPEVFKWGPQWHIRWRGRLYTGSDWTNAFNQARAMWATRKLL